MSLKTNANPSLAGPLSPAGSILKNSTFLNRPFYNIFTPPLTKWVKRSEEMTRLEGIATPFRFYFGACSGVLSEEMTRLEGIATYPIPILRELF
jgi:hypothetical protein